MDNKNLNIELRCAAFKNEGTRQRWQWFHQAIALAKQSNAQAMEQADRLEQSNAPQAADPVRPRAEPLLSIAR